MFSFDGDRPSQRELKKYFLDRNTSYFSQNVLAHVAYMILTIDRIDEMIQLALNLVVDKVGACRADMGFATPKDKLYEPFCLVLNQITAPPNCDGVNYCNQDAIFQKMWQQPYPVFCSDIAEDPMVADSRESFEAISSQSILFQRLGVAHDLIGLICVDFTNEKHHWQTEQTFFIQRFADTFLAPLILISQTWSQQDDIYLKKPTYAELIAIRLAAKGMRYKQIAWELGKSVRTIENQLRHARETMNACNQVDLIEKCQPFLDS